jgi:adenylate cyclase
VASVRQLAAIMFTDLAEFTQLAQTNEPLAFKLVEEQEALIRPIVQKHHGRHVKSMGDGLLIELPNALDAVECAVEIQQHVHERNLEHESQPLHLRIGVHLGDVQRRGGDIVGDAVNVASRIEPLAERGGICLSEHVFSQVRNKIPYQLESLGQKNLKGVREPTEVYRVVLPWLANPEGSGVLPPSRLAVLPFSNISPDPNDEYFADGLTEELISVLSRIRGLRVIARTSVNQYKATTKSVRQISSELAVGTVLEGSVRRAGTHLRITLQLIDGATEEHRWAETYNRELRDVFEIQAEVAERTAEALRLELLGAEREALHRAPTRDIEAYDLYLRGVAAFQRTADEGWTRPGVDEAARYFEAAIAKDPHSSAAHSSLANLLIAAMGEVYSRPEVESRIRQHVHRGLELDPASSEAHTALGNFALQVESDWDRSEAEFVKAVSLNPSNAPAHAWYGILLRTLGRFDQALYQFRLAAELDPLFRQLTFWQVRVFESAGDLEGALAVAKEALARYPGNRLLHIHVGRALLSLGRLEEAREHAAMAGGPINDAGTAVGRAELLALLGDPSEAERLVKSWESDPSAFFIRMNHIAALLAVLGQTDRAFELLERDAREGERSLWIDFRRPTFDPIRHDPRFVALLKEMKLPTAPPAPMTGRLVADQAPIGK